VIRGHFPMMTLADIVDCSPLPPLQLAAPKVSPAAPLDMTAGMGGMQPWDDAKMALVYWGSVNSGTRV
jgi:hypothetical protein